jgi:hypothetical protein
MDSDKIIIKNILQNLYFNQKVQAPRRERNELLTKLSLDPPWLWLVSLRNMTAGSEFSRTAATKLWKMLSF